MVIFSALAASTDVTPTADQYQQLLLREVFRDIQTEFMQTVGLDIAFRATEVRSADLPRRTCHLEFPDGVLSYFFILNHDAGTFRIDYLPQSVQELTIASCMQQLRLNTRYFPKAALNINLSLNQIFGTVNLQSLPHNLYGLDLSSNRLSGSISLFHLPDSLKHLNLRRNSLQQEVVYYGELPEPLVFIYLEYTRVRKASPIANKFKSHKVVIDSRA